MTNYMSFTSTCPEKKIDFAVSPKLMFFTVPLGDWVEKKKVPAIIIKQQFGFPMSTT